MKLCPPQRGLAVLDIRYFLGDELGELFASNNYNSSRHLFVCILLKQSAVLAAEVFGPYIHPTSRKQVDQGRQRRLLEKGN